MIFKTYLSHHGTEGQKWGVMNGPPYPLNDNIKAIAFRGGRRQDGSVIENFTMKDVIKARKIVDKNMKMMTEDEVKEYKNRLLMEADMNMVMHPKASKAKSQLADAAIDAATNSLKASGTKILTNLEVGVVGKIVENAFGEEAAAMITDGITTFQFKEKTRTKEKEDRDYELRKRQQESTESQNKLNAEKDKRDFEYKKQQDDYQKQKDEYQKQRDTIKDQQTDFTNQTARIQAENQTYANETARQKQQYDQEKDTRKAQNEAEGRKYADRKAEREFRKQQEEANYQREKETREFNEQKAQNEFDRAKSMYDMYRDYQDRQSQANQNYEYVKKEKNSDGTYTYYYDNDDDIYANVSPTNLIGTSKTSSKKSKKRK